MIERTQVQPMQRTTDGTVGGPPDARQRPIIEIDCRDQHGACINIIHLDIAAAANLSLQIADAIGRVHTLPGNTHAIL